jgi:chromosome segregation ATPase
MHVLLGERDALHASVLKKDNKLKTQSGTNQELNELVSKMHADLTQERQGRVQEQQESLEARDRANEELQRAVAGQQSAVLAAEEGSSKILRLQREWADQVSSLQVKTGGLQREVEAQAVDLKKQVKRMDRLEREKQDLLMEIASKAQGNKELQTSHDALRSEHESVVEDMGDKDALIAASKMEVQAKETVIRQLQSDARDHEEQAQVGR